MKINVSNLAPDGKCHYVYDTIFIDDSLKDMNDKIDQDKLLAEYILLLNEYNKLKEEFEFFSDRYPMLFDMATRDDEPFDWEALNYFLTMRSRVINNQITNEQASIKVGKEWFDKFVDVNELNKNKNAKRQKK